MVYAAKSVNGNGVGMEMYFSFGSLVSAALFLALGLTVYYLAFKVVVKAAMTTFRDEIVERNNVALALLVGLVSLGASIIIAAAVH
jgi:uncharacterized membrane protein YjfL (UPF0719 family)